MMTAIPARQTDMAQKDIMPLPNGILCLQPPSADITPVLPSFEVASLLVNTYFDRAHWFMPILHQEDFREKWQQLYPIPTERPIETNPSLGLTSTLLMTIVIGLQYMGCHRRQLLAAHNVDAATLKVSILATVRVRMMDIIALGSLEAVQTCILLATYYLHHGDPGLAWPICGSGLRIAQALNLHRKLDVTPSQLASMSTDMRRRYEIRKQCWWAIYEIEAFCTMSYGYPQTIRDVDCDVDLLDPMSIKQAVRVPNTKREDQVSTLSYMYLMSKLSIIIKAILNKIYGADSDEVDIDGYSSPCYFAGCSSILQHLVHTISPLETELEKWRRNVPPRLQLNNPKTTSATYASAEEMDQDIGASGTKFENYTYQLQALALEVAFQNVIILIYRPLLQYKLTHNSIESSYQPLDACRDAALRISEIGSAPIFPLAADTHAATLLGIQTFTAGVVLCLLPSTSPLTMASHKSKIGLHRLLSMQRTLASKSQLAAQALGILERLTRLAMEKEFKQMVARSDDRGSSSSAVGSLAPEGGSFSSTSAGRNQNKRTRPIGPRTVWADFEFRKDRAISQTLSDFYKGIKYDGLATATDAGSDSVERQLFPELSDATDRFARQQAWIWDDDHLAWSPGYCPSQQLKFFSLRPSFLRGGNIIGVAR
jgi:hypothetical protein